MPPVQRGQACRRELSAAYRTLSAFAAATGLRPEEWMTLERPDVQRRGGVVHVCRTVSSSEVVELTKTERSRRQVPLSPRAIAAIDGLPPRLDTPLLWPTPAGGLLNIRQLASPPAGTRDRSQRRAQARAHLCLRSTFASNRLAAGLGAFELAKVMGTSIELIERQYGTLLHGAGAGIAERLGNFEAEQDQATNDAAGNA